jgi:hypothetical protein
MFPDLEVEADELRSASSSVADTAARITTATRQEPPVVTTPRWAATDAATQAADAAQGQLAFLGADLTETATRIAAAAASYEAADARAAARLRSAR